MKQCLTLLFFVLLAGPSFGQQDDSNLASVLAAAQQAQAANNYAAAAANYRQAVKLRPDIPELRANLGLMQHEAGDFPEAIRSFQEALRQKPSLYVPNLFLGIDYVHTGKAKEAIPLLEKAEKMNATDPLPSLTLGRAWSSLGDYPSAVRAFRRALRLDPKQSSAWFDLGIAQLNQVEADARTMTADAANSPYAKALYAESLTKQSRYKEAASLYKDILAAEGRPPCMRSEAGFVALKQGDTQSAEQQFKSELSENPECGLAILGEARLRTDAGDNNGALMLLQQLWARDHGFFNADVSLFYDGLAPERAQSFLNEIAQQHSSAKIEPGLYAALAQSAQGTVTASDEAAEVAPKSDSTAGEEYRGGHYRQCADLLRAQLDSKNAGTLEMLAACAFFTGDYNLAYDAGHALLSATSHPEAQALYWTIKTNEKLAFESLARFQQLEPDSARSHILLGDIYRQRERYDDAQAEYMKALELSPNDPAALLGLASAYYGNAKMDTAVATAQKALAQSPDDPEINILMGEVLISQHKFTDAEPYLQKGLTAKPQMLPHVHALLGEAYASDGKTQDAIRELKLGADSDQDGSIHYYLAREYNKTGDKADAEAALQQMKAIQLKRREGAVIAVEDSHSSSLDESHGP